MNVLPTISVGWIVVPLLIAVILYDMRFMRIPNTLVVLFAIVALVSLPFSATWPEILWRICATLAVFIATMMLFMTRLMGGGDVKLLTAFTLPIPISALPLFGVILSLSIFTSVAALYTIRRVTLGYRTRWLAISDRSGFPLGLGIGVAGIFFILFGPSLMALR